MLNLKGFLVVTSLIVTLSLYTYVNVFDDLGKDKLGLAPNIAIGNPEDGNLGKFGNIEAGNTQEEKSDLSPNIVHFVHLSRTDNDKMPYYQYLAIKAARVNGKAERVILHYNKYLPSGKWFELAKRYLTECKKTDYELNSIYGHKVNSIEHKKDLVELYTLRDMGGLFLDLDVIILKPIQDLLKNDFTLVKAEIEADAKPFAFDPDARMVFLDRIYDFRENYATHLWQYDSGNSYTEALSAELIWSVETGLFCKLRNLTADEEGAGVWTEEMSKDCAIVNGGEERITGLIGHWPLTGITAKSKKAPDVSGNRMHGILSPMFGYKTKGSYFNEDYFTFNRGDHVYLPMVPEVTSVSFSLKLRFKLDKATTKNATVVCVLFNFNYQLNIYASSNSEVFMTVQLEDANKDRTIVANTSVSVENISGWRRLYVIGKQGHLTLVVASDTSETSKDESVTSVVSADMSAPYRVQRSGLMAIWLGKQYYPEEHADKSTADEVEGLKMADVKLFDYPVTLDSTV